MLPPSTGFRIVQQGVYDLLTGDVRWPTTAQLSSALFDHELSPDGTIDSHAYRIEGDDKLGPEITDFMAAYRDPTIQVQEAGATRQLSLWPRKEEGSAEEKLQ